MAAATDPHPLGALPDNLIRAVAREADRDADRVLAFLSALGLTPTPCRPIRLPREALLFLGAGLRLLAWEADGITAHRDAGLPPAREVVTAAVRALAAPAPLDPSLPVRVVRFHAEHFSWDAPVLLDADVLIGTLDEDLAAEAIAEYLWAARRPGSHDRRA